MKPSSQDDHAYKVELKNTTKMKEATMEVDQVNIDDYAQDVANWCYDQYCKD